MSDQCSEAAPQESLRSPGCRSYRTTAAPCSRSSARSSHAPAARRARAAVRRAPEQAHLPPSQHLGRHRESAHQQHPARARRGQQAAGGRRCARRCGLVAERFRARPAEATNGERSTGTAAPSPDRRRSISRAGACTLNRSRAAMDTSARSGNVRDAARLHAAPARRASILLCEGLPEQAHRQPARHLAGNREGPRRADPAQARRHRADCRRCIAARRDGLCVDRPPIRRANPPRCCAPSPTRKCLRSRSTCPRRRPRPSPARAFSASASYWWTDVTCIALLPLTKL